MGGRLIVLSDIHGNLSALEAVLKDISRREYVIDAIALLGDNINYGMRSEEVIVCIKRILDEIPVVANIFGNHEKAIMDGDTKDFSTDRGRAMLEYTRKNLSKTSVEYIASLKSGGTAIAEIAGKKLLFVHGTLQDPFWGKMTFEEIINPVYAEYDFVFSGHSHIPHLIEQFYPVENPEMRNKKRTVFLNPGSVGQPRNHNPKAQYLYVDLDNEIYNFNSVEYAIKEEQKLYTPDIDSFYSHRLSLGI